MRTVWVNLYRSPVMVVKDVAGVPNVYPGTHTFLSKADALRVVADYEDRSGNTDDYIGTVSLQVPDHG